MAIPKGILLAIHKGADQIESKLVYKPKVDYWDFCSLYLDDKQVNDMRNVMSFTAETGTTGSAMVTFPVTFEVPTTGMKCPTNFPYVFNIYSRLMPEKLQLRDEVSEQVLESIVAELRTYLDYKFHAALVNNVADWLANNCTNLQQMRYLFPPIVTLLTEGYQPQLAASLSTNKVPPNMPSLPPEMRQNIRYLNKWFATQILLGTFEDKPDRPTMREKREKLEVRFLSSLNNRAVWQKDDVTHEVSFG